MPPSRRHSLAKAWSTIKSVTPFVRSPSNRTILLNPELIEAVAGPLQRAKATAQHVLPVEAVADRLTSLRHHAASEVSPSRLPAGVPLDALKSFLPTAKSHSAAPRIALEDIWREIEIEKHLLVQQGPEIIAECERKLHGLLGHPPTQELDRVKTLVEQLGLKEEVLRGLLPHQAPTVETMQQLALLNRLLDAPSTSDLPNILRKAKTLADQLSPDHPSCNLPAKVLKTTVAHASHSEEPDKYQDLFSLLKAVSKASPKKEHNHVLLTLTHLANEVLDEKIELIKLSLSEAGVACHALYNSFFLLILAVMFCALTVFLLSLAMTQFLTTFLLVSYLDSLWITTAVALTIGLVLGLLGIAILKRTMVELRTLLLSPRELKKTKSFGKKKKTRPESKPKLDDDRLGSWIKGLAEEDAAEHADASPTAAVPSSNEPPQTQPDDVAPSTSQADIPLVSAMKEPEPNVDQPEARTETVAVHPPDAGKRPSEGLKRLPSISEDADEATGAKVDHSALVESEIAPLLSAMVSLVEALDCSLVAKTDDVLVVDLPRQDSSDCFGDVLDSDTQAEAWLLQDMANALQPAPVVTSTLPESIARVQVLLLPPPKLPTLALLPIPLLAIEPNTVASTTALREDDKVETSRVEAADESMIQLPPVPMLIGAVAIEPPTPLPPAPVVVELPSLVPMLAQSELPTQGSSTLARPRRVPQPTSLAATPKPKVRRRPSSPDVLAQRSRLPVVRMLSSPLIPADDPPLPSVLAVDDAASDDGSSTSDVPML